MTIVSTTTPFRVLIVGCSYAGLAAAVNLLDLSRGLGPRQASSAHQQQPPHRRVPVEITLVDERDGFFHLISSPLALASASFAPKVWVQFPDIPALQRPNVRFIHGTASGINPAARTATVTLSPDALPSSQAATVDVPYDFFVAASGLRRAWPVVPHASTRDGYLVEAGGQISRVARGRHGVVIVGGGAVGIEMAAELKLVQPQVTVSLVHSRARLLSSEPLPDEVADCALRLLREAGVEVLLEHRVRRASRVTGDGEEGDGPEEEEQYEVVFENGEKMQASEVVWAISHSAPTSGYLPRSVVDGEGYVKVQPSLRFIPGTIPNASSHYCAGDLALWSGIRRCGGAMHMGYYVAYNMHQAILARLDPGHEPALLQLNEFPPVIALAVGKQALGYAPGQGLTSGEDVMKLCFGDDLGFQICWNHLRLGVGEVDKEGSEEAS